MGDASGTDGPSSRANTDLWDVGFTRCLSADEFHGLRLVRTREPFKNYRSGFMHFVTGEHYLMNVVGELLYDDETGECIGGICWCHDLQPYADYVSEKQRQLLVSHETICNLMPHLVWTTTPDGKWDYSQMGGILSPA